jgi:hypothetical protein
VRSEAGRPSNGATCTKPVTGVAAAQALSPSTSPSIVGGSATFTAVANGRS